jgi:hypothetical protein
MASGVPRTLLSPIAPSSDHSRFFHELVKSAPTR